MVDLGWLTGDGPVACPPVRDRYTAAQLHARRPSVDRVLGRNIAVFSVGEGAGAIEVDLFQGHEDLAARLLRAFPRLVHVKVAGVEFCGSPSVSPKCPDLAVSATLPTGLHLTFDAEIAPVDLRDPGSVAVDRLRVGWKRTLPTGIGTARACCARTEVWMSW